MNDDFLLEIFKNEQRFVYGEFFNQKEKVDLQEVR